MIPPPQPPQTSPEPCTVPSTRRRRRSATPPTTLTSTATLRTQPDPLPPLSKTQQGTLPRGYRKYDEEYYKADEAAARTKGYDEGCTDLRSNVQTALYAFYRAGGETDGTTATDQALTALLETLEGL